MSKRNLATTLWFLTGWTLGLVLASTAGIPTIAAPAVGVALAAIVRWDPSGRLWHETH